MIMSQNAEKIFQRMIQTKAGWRTSDFLTLYSGFGFIIIEGKKHITVIHPDYDIRDQISRSSGELPEGYARDAVKNIKLLKQLTENSEEEDG
jgi:hypothetical protein